MVMMHTEIQVLIFKTNYLMRNTIVLFLNTHILQNF